MSKTYVAGAISGFVGGIIGAYVLGHLDLKSVMPPAAARASATRASGLSSYRPGCATAPLTKMSTVGGAGGLTVSPTGIRAWVPAGWTTSHPTPPARATTPAIANATRRGVTPVGLFADANTHKSVTNELIHAQAGSRSRWLARDHAEATAGQYWRGGVPGRR